MTIRLPQKYIVLLNRFSKKKNTVNVLVFEYKKYPTQLVAIHKGRITFTYDKRKLRPYRYEQKTGNSYRFYRDKDALQILQKASMIIISKQDRPSNVEEYLEFFKSKSILRPKMMPVCVICLNEYSQLTQLTVKSTYDLYGKQVCRNCAIKEVQEEYNRRGIGLTSSSKKFYNEQLNKFNSISTVIENLWNPLDSVKNKKASLYDVIEADKNSKPIRMKKFIEKNKLTHLVDNKIVDHWNKIGIRNFLPVQQLTLMQGLLELQDMLIVAGTSSGKTFISEIAGLHNWKKRNQKFVFVTPLIALSNQKYESFKTRYRPLGARVALRVGMSKIDDGIDEKIYPDGNFAKSDIIVGTYEALDWIFRSGQWKNIGEIGTFVIDEVQLLADEERGVVVDGIISRVKTLYPKCQIICLSATIGNPDELANELGLKLVSYLNRPIPLERHLLIANNEEEKIEIISELVKNEASVLSSTHHHGQTLVFAHSRRRVQELASLLKSMGIKASYYHAGMTYSNRKKIETLFENGKLEVVTTTAALGAGADFPVSQVIFDRPAMGARWISTAEFHQMAGRAGRFGFHDLGKAVMIVVPGEKIYSAQKRTSDQVAFEILTGKIEEIEGNIEYEDEMNQVLAYISAAQPVNDKQLATYYNRLFFRTDQLQNLLKSLSSLGLVVFKNSLWYISKLGRAISSSFLQPTFGYEIAKKTKKFDVIDIAIEISPIEIVYLSSKIHSQIERAVKAYINRKFLSEAVLEFITVGGLTHKKLPIFVVEKIKFWNRVFFDCSCKHNPYCIHPKLKLSKLVLELRLQGLSLSQIAYELSQKYDLFVYQGDLLSWLDELIHSIRSVARLAKAMNEPEIIATSKSLAFAIESGKKNIINTKSAQILSKVQKDRSQTKKRRKSNLIRKSKKRKKS